MRDQFFWLRWDSFFKNLFVALLILVGASIVYVAIAYFIGDSFALGWTNSGEWTQSKVIIDQFEINQVPISQDNHVLFILESYDSLNFQLHPWVSYLSFATLLTCLSIIIVILSYAELWFFILGMGIYMLFLITGKTESIALFGIESRVPIVLFLMTTVGLSYYFHAYGEKIHFKTRLALIVSLHILLFIIIQKFALVSNGAIMVSHYSFIVPLILTVIFILLTSKDTMHFFVVLTSESKLTISDAGNRAWNFLIIGGLYLGNLFLLWFIKSGMLEMKIFLIPPALLIIINVVLGIWMQKLKQNFLGSIIPYKPLGGILYLCLAIITLSTLGTAYMTANDALANMIERTYIYVHLGIGISMLLYVLINFWMVYAQPVEVYKVLFKPARISMFSMSLLGFLGVLALNFHSNFITIKLGKTGYNTHVGDAYFYNQDTLMGQEYYKEALFHARLTQKVNYVLAKHYESIDQKEAAFQCYQNLLVLNPTEYAYVAISNFYLRNEQLFPAIFLLKDGLKDYPSSDKLYNNLGYLYHNMNDTDSSIFFYEKAASLSSNEIPVTNLLAYQAASGNFEYCDNLIKAHSDYTSAAFLGNTLGYQTIAGIVSPTPLPTSVTNDSILTPYNYTILHNYTLSHLKFKDTTLLTILNQYIRQPENDILGEDLYISKLMYEFYSRTDVVDGLKRLREVALQTNNEEYFYLLANWQLRSGLFKEAQDSYDHIMIKRQQWTYIQYLLAAAELNELNLHSSLLQELLKSLSPEVRINAEMISRCLGAFNGKLYDTLNDIQKAQYLHYRSGQKTWQELTVLLQSINDPQIRFASIVDLASKLNLNGDYTKANILLTHAIAPEKPNPEIVAATNKEMLINMVGLQQWEPLKAQLTNAKLTQDNIGYLSYCQGKLLEAENDTIQAEEFFLRALLTCGYDENVALQSLQRLKMNKGSYSALSYYTDLSDIHYASGKMGWDIIQCYIDLGLYTGIENEVQRFQRYLTTEQIRTIQNQVNALQSGS
jgi:tetratricopeptide (TPR) repeat protein